MRVSRAAPPHFNSSKLEPLLWGTPNYFYKLCDSTLVQVIGIQQPLSPTSTSNHLNVFASMPGISEGRMDEAWELPNQMNDLRSPLPNGKMFLMNFPFTYSSTLTYCLSLSLSGFKEL
jgi:hypothetical protein